MIPKRSINSSKKELKAKAVIPARVDTPKKGTKRYRTKGKTDPKRNMFW